MRTDIRGFRLEHFGFPAPDCRRSRPLPPAAVDRRRGTGRRGSRRWTAGAYRCAARPAIGRARACSSAASTDGWRSTASCCGRICRAGRSIRGRQVCRAARRLLVRRHIALRAQGRGHRSAAAHSSRPWRPAGVDLGHTLVVLEEGAEATLLAETGQQRSGGRRAALRGRRVVVGPRRPAALREPAELGHGRLAFRPSEGARRSRRLAAMDHRRLGQPPGQSQSARGPGRATGAEAQVNGVMFTEGRQHLSYHTLQHHQAAGCRSDLLYKGALQDKSRIVWRGMIHVDRDAQKTDGYQRNDNLMLSDSARADSIPGLEILADDVSCTHGATVGRVDDEQIFYASSPRPDPQGSHPHDRGRLLPTGVGPDHHPRASARRWARPSAGACGNTNEHGTISSAFAKCQRHSRSGPAGIRGRRPLRGRCFTWRAGSTPWTTAARTTTARWAKAIWKVHDRLPAARGEVRHPRRPRARPCRPSATRRRTRSKLTAAKSW